MSICCAHAVLSLDLHIMMTTLHFLGYLPTFKVYIRGHAVQFALSFTNFCFSDYTKDHQYRCVQGFINAIPQNLLARASFNCESYTRALMHYDQFMRLKKAETNGQLDPNEHLDFLQVRANRGEFVI